MESFFSGPTGTGQLNTGSKSNVLRFLAPFLIVSNGLIVVSVRIFRGF